MCIQRVLKYLLAGETESQARDVDDAREGPAGVCGLLCDNDVNCEVKRKIEAARGALDSVMSTEITL